MNSRKLPSPQARLHRHPQGGDADYEEEEIDEVESLPRDVEHDEDERDPDPERYGAPSEHAQEQCRNEQQRLRRDNHRPR